MKHKFYTKDDHGVELLVADMPVFIYGKWGPSLKSLKEFLQGKVIYYNNNETINLSELVELVSEAQSDVNVKPKLYENIITGTTLSQQIDLENGLIFEWRNQ